MLIIDDNTDFCQYVFCYLERATSPDKRTALPLRRKWWDLKRHIWYASILGPTKYLSKIFPTTRLGRIVRKGRARSTNVKRGKGTLNLEEGDLVEVKSVREIFETLNSKGQHNGLPFTKEMQKFCGKRFRVKKRLKKIVLEATGELRTMKTPTVLLEGVICDGKAHGNCDRSCFCFWREVWLKPVDSSDNKVEE